MNIFKRKKDEGPIVIEIQDSKATQELRELRRKESHGKRLDSMLSKGFGVVFGGTSLAMMAKGVAECYGNNVTGGSLEVVLGAAVGAGAIYLIHNAITAKKNGNGNGNYTIS